jgi:prolyl 4-hydroxylase
MRRLSGNAPASGQQFISVELRQWIVAQAQAGVAPEAVLEAMKTSGWQEEVATKWLREREFV